MAAGYGRSRVDIGRCEAQGGAPRPPPQPTGPRGPLGPCSARLVPHRRPQHPRLDPRQRPRLAALMGAGGVREQPWCISSGGRPTQSPGSCSWVVWGAWGCSGQLQGRFMAVLSQLPVKSPAWACPGSYFDPRDMGVHAHERRLGCGPLDAPRVQREPFRTRRAPSAPKLRPES